MPLCDLMAVLGAAVVCTTSLRNWLGTASNTQRVCTRATGLKPLEPAYRRFLFMPQPGNETSASITLPTIAGTIVASFRSEPAKFSVTLSVPGNTAATVCLPRLGKTGASLMMDGKQTTGYVRGDYLCVDGVGSGPHAISTV